MFDTESLKDREQGRSCFILGNGPSILQHDLSALRDQVTIGMNASTALEEKFGFSQTYHTVSDHRFLTHPEKGHWAREKLSPETIRVLRADLKRLDDPTYEDRTAYTPHLKRDGFSFNLAIGYYYGCTTTLLALQLAAYLGCTNIYLLGVDLRYRKEAARFYAESAPQAEDSFTSVQIWNIANAARVLAPKGIKLFNSSPESFLRPHLPYQPFDELFPSGESSPSIQSTNDSPDMATESELHSVSV